MKTTLYWVAAIFCIMLSGCKSSIDQFPPEPKNSSIVFQNEADENICVDEKAGVKTITFTTKGGWNACMVNDKADEWCTITPASGAIGENQISIEYAENTTIEERNASFLIKSGVARKTVTITQKPANSISLTPSRIEVGAAGGTQVILARSKSACTATVAENAKSWISIVSTKSVETEITFDVAENTSFSKREGNIILSNGEITEEITVYQAGIEQVLVLSKETYAISSAAAEIQVEVTSNVPVKVTLPSVDWISESTVKATTSTNTYAFAIAENTGLQERKAAIIFSSEEDPSLTRSVTVTQSGASTDDPNSIRILAIGNSFSDDAMEYLYQILENAGYTSIKLGNLYIGSCTLETHAANIVSGAGAYTYRVNTTGTWTNTNNFSSVDAIKSDEWDYISMQQASGSSGMPERYEPYLTTLIEKVGEYCPGAELMWHMTWAYQGNSTHSEYSNYGNNQMTMYNAILSTVKEKVLTKDEISFVIPSGTAIQNLRTSLYGDNLTRDGYHLELSAGRYAAALMWAKQITGCDINKINWKPSGYIYSQNQIEAIKEAVNNAYAKPYEVTQSTYTEEEEEASLTDLLEAAGYNIDDYNQLVLDVVLHSYYNSSAGNADRLTNQNIYSSTQIFEKSEIPVGSIIVQKAGYQYRPDAWTQLDEATKNRPAEVQDQIVVVDEAWWGDFNYRGFNLSKNPKVALTENDKLEYSFGIFVPKPGTDEIVTNAGYDLADYTKIKLEITPNAHYNSSGSNPSSMIFTMTNYAATEILEKSEIPNGSLIALKDGYQYRPEGWIQLDQKNSARPDNVTTELVVVDDIWWGNFNYRAFNLAVKGAPQLDAAGHEELKTVFAIYVPKK